MNPQLSRLILIFGVLIALFVVTRWIVQPASFYQYGHYRGAALGEAAARPPHYAPPDACADCHEEQVKQKAAGPHAKISCQVCHGAADAHVTEPSTDNIRRPAVATLCVRCHAENAARPARFPQVPVKEHAEGKACNTCHTVHNPGDIHEEKQP